MMSEIVRFAWSALTGHRLRTSLCVLGVAVGIAAVVMLTALGEGARQYVITQFTSIGSNLLSILPGKTETTGAIPHMGGVANDLTLQDFLALQREIRAAQLIVPISMGTETVSRGERSRQVAVIGSTPDFLKARQLRIQLGDTLPSGDVERGSAVVVLGKTIAQELFPGQQPVGQVVRVGEWRMRVIGVLGEIGTQLAVQMDEVVLVPVATGLRMFNRSSLFRILMKVRSSRDLDATCVVAIRILTERHDEEDVTCITQQAVVSTFSSILQTFTLVLVAIAGISLSVAGIGVMNVMLVTVSERTQEIGLLRALGATRGHILRVFLVESVLLAGLGGLVGLATGLGVMQLLVWMYPAIPAQAPWWAVGAAFLMSVVMGGLFGVLPARRAAKLDPMAALQRR
ncbi:MAG TPA: ABC transporter permease [Nitrospirales bacterium]|nr:peptide ABC transporter permease [Nitrospiraceae bacterium]HNP30891.1 ABC transporter permease [Nitrospirales bacterium]